MSFDLLAHFLCCINNQTYVVLTGTLSSGILYNILYIFQDRKILSLIYISLIYNSGIFI